MSDMTPEQVDVETWHRNQAEAWMNRCHDNRNPEAAKFHTAMADTVRRMRELIDTAAVWARDGYVPADESAVDDFLAKVDALTEHPHAD